MHYALPVAIEGCQSHYGVRASIDAQKLAFGHAFGSTEACFGYARIQHAAIAGQLLRVFRPNAARDPVPDGEPGTAHGRA